MSIQDKITPVKPITVLIFLNIQESTGPVLSIQVRHVPDLQRKTNNKKTLNLTNAILK